MNMDEQTQSILVFIDDKITVIFVNTLVLEPNVTYAGLLSSPNTLILSFFLRLHLHMTGVFRLKNKKKFSLRAKTNRSIFLVMLKTLIS